MNRTLYQDRGSLNKRLADIYLKFTAGTSGAVPSTFDYADGIASVVLDSTGVLSIHLQDNFVALVGVDAGILQSSLSATTANKVTPKTDDSGSATDPKVVLNLLAQDGSSKLNVAANMATGDVFFCHLTFIR